MEHVAIFSFISKVYNQKFLNLNNNTMSAKNSSNSSNNMDYLYSVSNDIYYLNQIFCFDMLCRFCQMLILQNQHPKCRFCKIDMFILQNRHVDFVKST